MSIRNVISVHIPRTVALIVIIAFMIGAGIAMQALLRPPSPSDEEQVEFAEGMEVETELFHRLLMESIYVNQWTEIIEMVSEAASLDEISLTVDQAKELLPLLEKIQRTTTTVPKDESWEDILDAVKAVWGEGLSDLLDKHESGIEMYIGDLKEGNPFAEGERKVILEMAIEVIRKNVK